MGLQEKRAMKEFQDNQFPELVAKINEAAASTMEIEVDWDSMSEDDHAHLFETAWPKVYFEPLIAALKKVCVDDMGREALREGVQKIVFCNRSDSHVRDHFALEGGVLTIDHKPFSNIDRGAADREQWIENVLNAAL